MHRASFFTKDTVTFTLFFMITNNTTYCCQWIVFKKHPTCIVQSILLKETYDLGDRRAYRTALLTSRVLTLQASVCLIKYM